MFRGVSERWSPPRQEQLARSVGCIRLHLDRRCAALPQKLVAEARRVGADLRLVPGASGGRTVVCSVSHGAVDGYGALFFLAHFGAALAEHVAADEGGEKGEGVWEVERESELGDYACLYRVDGTVPAPDRRTHAQRSIESVLEAAGLPADDLSAVVLAPSAPPRLTTDTYRARPFGVVRMAVGRLQELASGDRVAWRSALEVHAEPHADAAGISEHPRVLFSSMGDLATVPWARANAALDPRFLDLASSPFSPVTANVLLWARGEHQAITLCARPEHPLFARAGEIFQAWRAR